MIGLFAGPSAPAAIGGVLRSDNAVLRATTFWEFPIRTLYREFPESRAFRSPQSPCRHAVDRGLGSGSELQELAGGTLDFETLIVVRDRPRMRGGGNRHVPKGLDRPLLLDQVDRLDRLHHAGSKPLGEKGMQIVLDPLLAGRLDRLHDRLGRPLVVLFEDGGDLFQPAIGGAFRVADADLRILVGTPHNAVRADIVEQEEPEAERLVAGLGVPDKEPAGHRARAVAPARYLDAPVFVGQEHKHVAIAREKGRVLPRDGDAVAELTRHAPVPRDTIAKALDERIDDIRVPDPAIGRTGRGAQLATGWDAEAIVLVAQRREHTDVLDLAGEAPIVVQRIRDDVGRHSALAEVRCRGRRRRETADLPEGLVRRCQQLAGERPPLDAAIEAAVLGIALVGQYRQGTGAFDSSPGALPAPGHL